MVFPFPASSFSPHENRTVSRQKNSLECRPESDPLPCRQKKLIANLKQKTSRHFVFSISEQATKAGLGMKTGHERLPGRSAVGMILAILWGVVVRVKTRFNSTRSLVTIKSLQL